MLPIWLLLGFALLGATSADFSHPAVVPDLQLKNSHLTKSSLTKRINLLERLPASLTAIHYDIWIKPYFPAPGVTYDPSRDFTFDAKTTVRVKATEDAGSIVLNARYLNFSSYSVVRNDGQTVPIHGFYYNDTTEQIILSPRSVTIQKGSVYDVSFVYTGLINYYQDGGLFYTNYVDPSGQKHWMVATQFESTDARRVFPGLDEPSYKATFSITVAYPTSLVVLSNMYEDDPTTLDNGYSQVAFPNTPRMATYLVAFAIGPFVSFEYMNEDHTLVRSWGWPGTEQYLSFAAMNAGFCLYQMGQYTGMQYPLEKSDQLGLPEFPAGAMENWGLVIYKYQYIAYNPTTMTTADMENAVKVICHELAHQWFGDLVTLAWWDDLFLNEGFADYFMRYIQGKVYPNQAVYLDTLHVREELEYALQADIAPSAHPLVAPDGPHFDLITYRKGSSMLRMLSDVLGEDVFQAGLKSYLYIYQYSNANHEYLFDALTEAAQEARVTDWCGRPFNVSVFMEPYVHQTNFPLINFVNNDFNHYATFSQDPFQNSSSLPQTDWNYYWPIPLRTVRYDNYSYVQQWIVPSNQACTGVGEKKALHWEVADITTAAYGRVKYDDVGFDRLIQKLQTQSIPPQVMVTLLGDEIAYIARQQATNAPFSYDRFLTLAVSVFNIQSFIHQPSFSAGDVAYSTLEAISTQLRDHMDYPLIKRLHEKIFSNTYQHIPWINTDDWDKDTFQASFLPLAVRLNIGDSANRTLQMFAKIKTACAQSSNGTAWCNPIPTNFRRAVYCGAVKNSVQMANDNFAQVLQYYNAEVVTNPYFYQEYLALLEGLTCTEASSTLKVTIRLFLKSPLNPNVIFSWFKTNPYASDALASYLNDRPSEVLNFTGLDAYLDAMTYNWRSEKRFLQLNRILNTLQLNTAQQRVFNKYLLRTQQQVTYNTRYLPRLLNWLYDNLVVRGETPWTQRVSDALVPTSYQLTLQPFIPGSGSYDFWSNMTFTAFLTMEFDLIVPVQEIQLTAHRLLIDVSTIYLTDGTNNTILLDTGIRKDYDNAFLYIPSPTTLQEGHYTLTMSYQGLIFNKPSDGVDSNWNFYEFDGKQGWIFTTDFEGGPSVRSLLPCIDEPSYKAEFTVSLIHPADMTALSNTLDTGMTILDKGWAQTTFQTTPKMSSYLLAICFGHFSSVSKVSNTGVLVRLFTWTGMERYGDFGLQVMAGTVDFMATYFNYPFPLPKLDAVALPQYSTAGSAMENWGLILGSYEVLLVDMDYATTAQLTDVAEVTAHETVHQWFGDLVSPDWWSNLFLNEAFAQYWYANGINYTFPEQSDYAIDFNRFQTNAIALEIDCNSKNSRPVISDAPPLFSNIIYYKGSSLLNLLSNTLSPAVLQTGLQNYLQSYKYSNANAQDLWAALTQAARDAQMKDWNGSPLDVSSFMDPYTLEASYPILKLTFINGMVSYEQVSCIGNGLTWNIPVFSQTTTGEVFNWFVGANGNSNSWNHTVGSPYQIDNTRSSSYARVLYDDQSWANLLKQLTTNPNVFDPSTRASILDDGQFFVQNELWNVTRWLDLSLYLQNEYSLAPWKQALPVLKNYLSRFRYQPYFNEITNYVARVTENAYVAYGWRITTKWTNNALANDLTNIGCATGFTDCSDLATLYFEKFVTTCQYSNYGTAQCSNVSPDLRKTMYCYGNKLVPNDQLLLNLYGYYANNATYFDRDGDNLLHALGCTGDAVSLRKLITMVIFGQLPTRLLRYIGENNNDGLALYNFLISNTQQVALSNIDFKTFVRAMALNWSTDDQVQKMEHFMSTEEYQLLNVQQQKDWRDESTVVSGNNLWIETHGPVIRGWINQNIETTK